MTPHVPQAQSGPLFSEFAKDPDMIELVELFVNELPARIKAMQEAIAANNLDVLKRAAHQLKGAGGGYGFPSVSAAAGRLEHSIVESAGGPSPTATAIPTLPPESLVLAKIRKELDDLVNLCNRARAA